MAQAVFRKVKGITNFPQFEQSPSLNETISIAVVNNSVYNFPVEKQGVSR